MRGVRKIEGAIGFTRVAELLTCDFENGLLYWNERPVLTRYDKSRNTQNAGNVAGHPTLNSIQVTVVLDGIKHYTYAHRLIMAFDLGDWVPPEFDVDHINNDSFDNRLINLRICDRSGNAKNRRQNNKCAVPFKGVSLYRDNLYRARIMVGRKSVKIGLFDCPIEAARAYDAEALRLHGEFAKTNAMLGLL